AGGQTVDVGASHIHLRDSNTDYQMYSGYKQLVVSFPDLTAGDVIEVKWSLRGMDPEANGLLYGAYNLRSDTYPMVHDELRVRVPRGRTLRFSVRGGTAEPVVSEQGDNRMYHWQVKNRPALPADKDVPSKDELRLRVFYSTAASWEEVA